MSKEKNKYSDPLRLGVDIAQKGFENEVGTRNAHDDDADLFASLGAMAGPKPRGAAALFSGFAKGAELGSRSKSTAKKQEALSKHNRVMDYFRTQVMEMEKMKKWEMQKEQEAEILRPYAVGGLETAYSGMPYEQGNEAMRNIFDQMKINNPNIKGDYVSYVPNSPLLNIRDENGKYTVFPLTKYAGEEVSKRVQGEFIEKQRLGVNHDQLEVQKFDKGLPSKFGNKANQAAQAGEEETLTFGDHSYKIGSLQAAEKTARAEYQKKVYKEIDAIPKNNQALKAIETMREVFDRNPNIGTSMINMLDNPDGVDSWMNIAGRKLAGQDLTDMEILRKATNDLNLDTILGISGKSATDLLKKAVQSASPSGKLTKGGFDAVSAKWEEKAREANDLAQAKYEAMQQGKSLLPTAYKGKSAQSPAKSQDDGFSDLGKLVQ